VGASSAWREQASSHGEELGADNWTQEERRVGDAVGELWRIAGMAGHKVFC